MRELCEGRLLWCPQEVLHRSERIWVSDEACRNGREETADSTVLSPSEPVNTDILVASTIPAGSGLSSSAAMVVASTLAFLAVNEKLELPSADGSGTRRITRSELVEMAVENEKRVGVNSGGCAPSLRPR